MSTELKSVAYARCSLVIEKGQNPENQLVPIRQLAIARNLKLTKEYVDFISGTKDRRPQLDELLKDARMGRFKILICYSMDRLARDVRFLLNLLHELDGYGCQVIFLRESIDFSTPVGKACLSILGSISQLERDLISDRIKTALAVKKLTAEKTGNGWRSGRKPLSPEKVEHVKRLLAQNRSIRATARIAGVGRTTVERIKRGKR